MFRLQTPQQINKRLYTNTSFQATLRACERARVCGVCVCYLLSYLVFMTDLSTTLMLDSLAAISLSPFPSRQVCLIKTKVELSLFGLSLLFFVFFYIRRVSRDTGGQRSELRVFSMLSYIKQYSTLCVYVRSIFFYV